MNNSEIIKVFERFGQLQAIVIGDVMIDSYMWGKVERISPEAPVPVVSITKREKRLGGAANVSLNIQSLGAKPLLFSVIGEDSNGRLLKKLLRKRGLSDEGILTQNERITTIKNRIISEGQHIARVDEETTENINPGKEAELISSVTRTINDQRIDVIIFVDYNKGVITRKLFREINKLALEKGIPTTVDPKKNNFLDFKNVMLFKPNFKEFKEGTGLPLKKDDIRGLKIAAEEFRKKQNINFLFLTLSELGVLMVNGANQQYIPAVIRYVSDVSGAGDTVISVASLALAVGMDPENLAVLSNIAGGVVCEKLGVVPIEKEKLISEMAKLKLNKKSNFF